MVGAEQLVPVLHPRLDAGLSDGLDLQPAELERLQVEVEGSGEEEDAVAVGGLQIQMVRRISQIYDVEFSENRGKALIASLAGSLIPATSGIGAASMLKAVPIIGTIAGGFVMPVLSAGATYAIGKAFIQHFATGGTLLDFNPPDYREFIRAQRDMWDSRRKGRGTKSSTEATTSP